MYKRQNLNVANAAVIRDASGNFSAGTITASLSGAASANVLKTGDTMTGTLTITGAGSNFNVSGNAQVSGTTTLSNDLAVDSDTLFVDVSTDRVGINAGVNPVAPLHVQGDGGIMIRTSSNNVGAQIRFSDHQSGSYGQQGRFFYQHGDASTGFGSYNDQFQIEGTEALTGFRVVGDIIASRRLGVNISRIPNFAFEVAGDAMITGTLNIDEDNDLSLIHI